MGWHGKWRRDGFFKKAGVGGAEAAGWANGVEWDQGIVFGEGNKVNAKL